MTSPNTLAAGRLHGLDAARAIALLLGILVHASMSFIPGAPYFWIVADIDPQPVLALAFYVPHMFRMLLFFLLAGFFGRLLLDRLGSARFLRDRGRRIVLPLLAGWPLVMAAIVGVLVWNALIANGGTLPDTSPPGPAFTPDDFPLTHLWFLYVLILCYAGMLIVRAAIAAVDARGRLGAFADRLMAALAGPTGPALLALPLAATLFLLPLWHPWFGIPTPDRSLYPNLAAIVGYGGAFAFGWLLQRQSVRLRGWARTWPWHLAVALCATAGCLWFAGISPGPAFATRTMPYAVYAFGYALAAWSWTFALIGLCLRCCSDYGPVRRYLADASYWIYLAHLPLVMALQVAVARLQISAWLKFPAIVIVAVALLLLAYRAFVRNTIIGAVLNGRRARVEPAEPAVPPAPDGRIA